MNENILKGLYETFELSTRQGTGGMTFKYVPNEDVINRMNKVFKGNWSTTVRSREMSDDQMVVEVEVSVVDPDNGLKYSHAGFGSQQIMKYNSGPNAGKVIDIGNAYKGALAKAIVNACTRWGVGLFKESNPYEDEDITIVESPRVSVPTQVPPAAAAAPAVPPPAAAPAAPTAPAANTPPPAAAPPAAAAPAPVAPAKTVAAPVPMPTAPMPTAPAAPPVVEQTTTFPPPIAPNQPVAAEVSIQQAPPAAPELPKIPAPSNNVAPPTTPDLPFSKDEGLENIGISDVQRVALNGILTMNNANYTELAQEAFAANSINKPVPNKEDLNYDEAVVVIKFGNEKYRKNR